MTLHAPPKPPAANPADAFFDDPTIYYPDGDGKPMAETPEHLASMVYGLNTLTALYADDPNVWVTGNNFIYYEPNNPRVRVSPDIYVVFDVPKSKRRRSFYTWRENNKTPSIVFEFTSNATKYEDIIRKRDLYEQVLCVPEYILFDPIGDYLTPPLQGFRLVNGAYVPIVPIAPGRLFSHVLNLEIVDQGDTFRFFDPYTDVDRRAKRETARANEEAARRTEAEAEVARLRAALAQLTPQKNEDAA